MSFPRSSLPLIISSALASAFVAVVIQAGGQGGSSPALTVLTRDGRRALPLTTQNDQEFVSLDDVSATFQLTAREESLGTLTVTYKGKTILLTADQPLVSVSGRLVSLPAAPTRSGRRWMVPVEFINRALGLVYDARLDLRKSSRLVVVGDLRVPRVRVRFDGGDPARVVFEATPPTTSTVSQEGGSLIIKFDADALDAAVPPIQPQPLVRAVRIIEPATLAIDLGPRFVAFRAASEPLDTVARLTIDVLSTQLEPQTPPGASPVARDNPELPPLSPGSPAVRTIVIDPGHGGDDEGVKGAAGAKEKDLALGMARRVKAQVENRLGVRVLLTRDDDRDVPLDSRTATANNSKADMLISLHANASFNPAAAGASILYAAFDHGDAPPAPGSVVRLPTFGGGLREIDLVLWDHAQSRHLDQSAALAQALEAQFREGHVPLAAHAIDRAPLSVLESANMPAVLVEMGYLTNRDQERALAGPELQNAIVQAIFDATVKFRDSLTAGGR